MGSLQILCLFDTATFWVLPLIYVYLPKIARAYLFPQSVEMRYFCSGPISVHPGCCPQPTQASHPGRRLNDLRQPRVDVEIYQWEWCIIWWQAPGTIQY